VLYVGALSSKLVCYVFYIGVFYAASPHVRVACSVFYTPYQHRTHQCQSLAMGQVVLLQFPAAFSPRWVTGVGGDSLHPFVTVGFARSKAR
jgi:hypothetical protein